MVDQFGYHILEEVIKMMMEVFLSEEKAKKHFDLLCVNFWRTLHGPPIHMDDSILLEDNA